MSGAGVLFGRSMLFGPIIDYAALGRCTCLRYNKDIKMFTYFAQVRAPSAGARMDVVGESPGACTPMSRKLCTVCPVYLNDLVVEE